MGGTGVPRLRTRHCELLWPRTAQRRCRSGSPSWPGGPTGRTTTSTRPIGWCARSCGCTRSASTSASTSCPGHHRRRAALLADRRGHGCETVCSWGDGRAGADGGRAFVGWLTTAMPMTYAEEFGPRTAGEGTIVALWTDDVGAGRRAPEKPYKDQPDIGGRIRRDATVSLVAACTWRSTAPSGPDLPPGDGPAVASPESFGPDLALARAGASASASSSAVWNPPAKAIDGDSGAGNVGELAGSPAWGSGYGDGRPQLTVRFGAPRDRSCADGHLIRRQHDARHPQLAGGRPRRLRCLAARRRLPQPLLQPRRGGPASGLRKSRPGFASWSSG